MSHRNPLVSPRGLSKGAEGSYSDAMAEPTAEQLELTNLVVQRVTSVDWDGDIDPYVDEILSILQSLLAMDAERVDFVEVIRDQAAKWSLAAWGANLASNLRDSGWSHLADRLAVIAPRID